MTSKRVVWLPLLLLTLLAGCASTPKLTQDEILAQYDQIAALDKGLKDAAAQGVDYLAPEGYSSAQAQLQDALSEAHAGRSATANSAAAAGLSALATANDHAATSREVLREVLEARKKADSAGAPGMFPEQTREMEEQLRKAGGMVERGRLDDAKNQRPELISGYEKLQLAALKEGTVEAAKAAVDMAKKNDAPKFAPKTYKLAEEEMRLAESVLEADRTRTEKANAHAKRAKFLAEQSTHITELIRDFDRRDYTSEDTVLWYQQQLEEINAPLGKPLPFDEPNRGVVLGMQQSIKDLIEQRDATAAQRSQYEQELSLTAEQRAAIDKVIALFTPAEATVYQQKQNVLISAHGFHFPPGSGEIGPNNFALMNKIIQAVQTFPGSYIEISGHTDSTGSDAINKKVSQARADNVAKFLIEVGHIAGSRIIATGYGEERPVASNATPEGRAANRRVEILINNQ